MKEKVQVLHSCLNSTDNNELFYPAEKAAEEVTHNAIVNYRVA